MPAFRSTPRRWTRTEVRALVDAAPLHSPRYELVDGELLVTPSPAGPHQKAVVQLVSALVAYLSRHPVGDVLVSPFDVELEPDTMVQPDVFVVPSAESERLRTEMPARALLLAIEIVSAGSARFDRGPKRELYQRHVPEYWIVDLDARLVERWRSGDERPEILHELLVWQPAGSAEALEIDLPGLFDRVCGAGGG